MENKDSLGVWRDSDQQTVGSHCGTLPGELCVEKYFYDLIFYKNLEFLSEMFRFKNEISTGEEEET